MVVIKNMLDVTRISRVNALGMKPSRGGSPPIDISRMDIGIVVVGLIFCHDIIAIEELVKFRLIKRIMEVVITM